MIFSGKAQKLINYLENVVLSNTLMQLKLLNERFDLFKTAFTTVDGHKMVLEDADGKSSCEPNDIFRIRVHCQCLHSALIEALKIMHIGKKWLDCCEHSTNMMISLGHDFIHLSRTASTRNLLCCRSK